MKWNVKVQSNSIKKFVLDAAGDLVGKVDKKTRETWITQEITYKTGECGNWKKVNNDKGRKGWR